MDAVSFTNIALAYLALGIASFAIPEVRANLSEADPELLAGRWRWLTVPAMLTTIVLLWPVLVGHIVFNGAARRERFEVPKGERAAREAAAERRKAERLQRRAAYRAALDAAGYPKSFEIARSLGDLRDNVEYLIDPALVAENPRAQQMAFDPAAFQRVGCIRCVDDDARQEFLRRRFHGSLSGLIDALCGALHLRWVEVYSMTGCPGHDYRLLLSMDHLIEALVDRSAGSSVAGDLDRLDRPYGIRVMKQGKRLSVACLAVYPEDSVVDLSVELECGRAVRRTERPVLRATGEAYPGRYIIGTRAPPPVDDSG